MPYKLSAVLFGHSMDVRAIAVIPSKSYIISTSRDKTAKIWKPNGFNNGYVEEATLRGHTSFVSCVCVLPPSNIYKEGLILTGGCDNNICAFRLESLSNPTFILQGHKENVCCLNAGASPGFVLSSSWDKTAKVWSVHEEKCILTLTGHESSVWSVIQLTSGFIITGSADKTIRVYFPDGTYQRTITGHTDCVRGLAPINENTFYSCANDATIRKWNAQTGESLEILYGHSHYIYSISVLGNLMVSGGEDKAVRIWQSDNPEILTLPSQSIWAVACLPNLDIVTGSNDGVVRIFSADPKRQADKTLQAQFAQEVAAFTKTTDQEIGGIKISDLPGRETLYEPGHTDGQTKIINEGNVVVCYSWSMAENKWNKIGDVTGAQGQAGKQLYNGREYDYVFSVDIEDGKPPLKLPYNTGEDPWVVAQEFIHKNNLSQHFLEQVANFIIKNSTENKPVTPGNAQYTDPFTGGARYIPGGSGNSSSSGTDPFTGSNRYVPTGQNSTSSSTPNSIVHSNTNKNFFPQNTYLRFEQANVKLILEKLEEFNEKCCDGGQSFDKNALEEVIKLCNADALVSNSAVDTLKSLLNWPEGIVFPVLDITRLAIRNSDVNTVLCSGSYGNQMFSILKKYLAREALSANQMLVLRIISNMLSHRAGEALVIENRQYLLAVIRELVSPNASKNLQVALATLLLNLTVGFVRQHDERCQAEAMATISLILPYLPDPEATFRCLVAAGTLITANTKLKEELPPDTISRLHSIEQQITDSSKSKIAACSSQLLKVINEH